MISSERSARLARLRLSLDGLSIGDGFGETFFRPGQGVRLIKRLAPEPPWTVTDDTVMALSIAEQLEGAGVIDQDALALAFARRHAADPMRGYGGGARQILKRIEAGAPWRVAARQSFEGKGSLGNGGAMRVAPLGAFFADDLELAASEAARSAEVTHAHPEGQAGAVAIAVAAALAARQGASIADDPCAFVTAVAARTPAGPIRDGISRAAALPVGTSIAQVARAVGNGSRVIALDTVPLCVWAAARYARSFEDALWQTVSVVGDMDTTCAIVGGIVALSVGADGIPPAWRTAREPLPWHLGR